MLGVAGLLVASPSAFSQTDYTYSTIAGIATKPGNNNGIGGSPLVPIFNHPIGVVVNANGNIYVADAGNAVIRQVTPAGVVTTFVGTPGKTGGNDGTTTDPNVTFNSPQGPAVDGAGNLYVADFNGTTIRKITPAGVVTTLAGSPGSAGSTDGTGSAARFSGPSGLALDAAGNVYVADSKIHVIRKITPAGVVSTIAGTAGVAGSLDGQGAAARFNNPRGIASDATGNLFIADTGNNTIRKITPAGAVSTIAGAPMTFGGTDGTGTSARFSGPNDLAVDQTGNIFVADELNGTIRKITPAGVVTTLAGLAAATGRVDGSGTAARFDHPVSVTLDATGNLYVADYNNHLIRKVSPEGVVSTVAGAGGIPGLQNGTGYALSPALLRNPTGTAVDSGNNVYVSDTANNSIRRIAVDGTVTLFAGNGAGSGSVDGLGSAARFNAPAGLAFDAAGNLFVADSTNHTIRKVTPAGAVTTYAGVAGTAGSANGPRAEATFDYPSGVAVDSAGNVYVADYSNHVIRMISASGVVTTLAGSVGQMGGSDGMGAAARFNYPRDLAVDASGNIYVADSGNHTVRKISPGGLVLTLAGSAGVAGSADGGGNTARFDGPAGLGVDAAGNVFVTDTNNNTVRKITPGGVVSTIGGTKGVVGTADGTGSNALFNHPTDVAVDASGNLYIADNRNHTIRRGSLPGSTGGPGGSGSGGSGGSGSGGSGSGGSGGGSGGGGSGGSAGDGTIGTGFLLHPSGIVVDATGSFLICDTANNCIRKITSAGAVSTLAGKSGTSGTVDGTGDAARFNTPTGIVMDGTGNFYVTDTGNATIRKVTAAGVVTTLAGSAGNRGSTDGTGTAALFSSPSGIAFYSLTTTDSASVSTTTETLYVADSINCTIRKVTTAGVVTTFAGAATIAGDVNGVGVDARFNNPTGVSLGLSGTIVVTDTYNNTIRTVRVVDLTTTSDAGVTTVTEAAGTVKTLAGSAGLSGAYDGPGEYALFNLPQGVSVDSASAAIYVADTGNNCIRRISSTGVVTTVAGIAGISGNRSGTGEQALFNQPQGIYSYASTYLVIADTGNSILRTVGSSTGFISVVSTLALSADTTTTPTTPTTPSSGGGGGAPSLWFLGALAALGLARRLRSIKS